MASIAFSIVIVCITIIVMFQLIHQHKNEMMAKERQNNRQLKRLSKAIKLIANDCNETTRRIVEQIIEQIEEYTDG